MSEKQTALQLPYENLGQVLASGEQATPADPEDFQSLSQLVSGVVAAHHYPARYPEYRTVSSSTHLRQAGTPNDAPRIRVTQDPDGEQYSRTGYAGRPTLSFHIDQGIRSEDERTPRAGSWRLKVDLMDSNEGPMAVITGGTNGRRGKPSSFPFSSPSAIRASKELIVWLEDQIGNPDTLEAAPTSAEKRFSRLLGRIGLGDLTR
jgi:hypothetical protein